jgi:1-phosphofructokinase family hexose kinase
MHVLVVNPNLCFDRTLWVEAFEAGTVSRPYRVEVTAGGKGVNVARTVGDLGGSCTLLGLVADHGGEELLRLLAEEDIDVESVAADGSVRSATIVIEDSQRATVLNEPGPVVDATHLEALLTVIADTLDGDDQEAGDALVVCSGSLPPGLPVDTYAQITRLAHEHGGECIVDGARAVLAEAIPAGPDLVCPNLDEAEGLTTGAVLESSHLVHELDDVRDRALSAAQGLRARGALRAVVTASSHGAAYADETGEEWIPAPRVEVANPIGAGDSFVGGVAAARAAGTPWAESVRRGVVVASAAVENPRAGRVDPHRVEQLVSATEQAAR